MVSEATLATLLQDFTNTWYSLNGRWHLAVLSVYRLRTVQSASSAWYVVTCRRVLMLPADDIVQQCARVVHGSARSAHCLCSCTSSNSHIAMLAKLDAYGVGRVEEGVAQSGQARYLVGFIVSACPCSCKAPGCLNRSRAPRAQTQSVWTFQHLSTCTMPPDLPCCLRPLCCTLLSLWSGYRCMHSHVFRVTTSDGCECTLPLRPAASMRKGALRSGCGFVGIHCARCGQRRVVEQHGFMLLLLRAV